MKIENSANQKLNMLLALIVLFTSSIRFSNAQCINFTQVGLDIKGEANGDESGESVSISADGLTVAIGAPKNAGGGIQRGHVRVYENISGKWVQKGGDIDGEYRSGMSVSLSSDGLIVAIGEPRNSGGGAHRGKVRVYKYISGTWIQQGTDINGENENDRLGWSVSLSSDGLTIAIGAPNFDQGESKGCVRVYKIINGFWTKQGSDIIGEENDDLSGFSVSLSSDGYTVAIGAPNNTNKVTHFLRRGHVRIYKYIDETWTQLGTDIDGEKANDQSGWSVSLSSDGLSVAIGAPYNAGLSGTPGFARGHVRIYKFINGTWIQQGEDIKGEWNGDLSGWSVSLSDEGLVIAIGSYANAGGGSTIGTGSQRGHVRVYYYLNDTWKQKGSDIYGKEDNDRSGWSVSISSDGSMVAIGAPQNTSDTRRGIVRVYQCDSNVNNIESAVAIYPNPFNETLNLDLNLKAGETAIITLNNLLGKTFLNQIFNENNKLDLKYLSSGIYILSVQIETNFKSFKVIKI